MRDAGRAYADRPWAECRWHPPKREPLVVTGPSFFAAPKKQEAKEADSKADAKDAKDSDDDGAKDVAEAKALIAPVEGSGVQVPAPRVKTRRARAPWEAEEINPEERRGR